LWRSTSGPGEEGIVLEIKRDLAGVWRLWRQMDDESASAPPVQRLVYTGAAAGRNPYVRDLDYNIDGFAHYGLLPDLLQELKNVGLSAADRGALFRSAEEYMRMWEKCWRLKR
jgi:hypothetical protein